MMQSTAPKTHHALSCHHSCPRSCLQAPERARAASCACSAASAHWQAKHSARAIMRQQYARLLARRFEALGEGCCAMSTRGVGGTRRTGKYPIRDPQSRGADRGRPRDRAGRRHASAAALPAGSFVAVPPPEGRSSAGHSQTQSPLRAHCVGSRGCAQRSARANPCVEAHLVEETSWPARTLRLSV